MEISTASRAVPQCGAAHIIPLAMKGITIDLMPFCPPLAGQPQNMAHMTPANGTPRKFCGSLIAGAIFYREKTRPSQRNGFRPDERHLRIGGQTLQRSVRRFLPFHGIAVQSIPNAASYFILPSALFAPLFSLSAIKLSSGTSNGALIP